MRQWVNKFNRYFRVYIKMSLNSFSIWYNKKEAFSLFLLGKVFRYLFYFSFLYFLTSNTKGFAGYEEKQILFIAITYVLVDTLSQFLFRSVYSFRQLVVSGDLDLIMTKPINTLFRSLLGGMDLIDLITLPFIIIAVVMIASTVPSTTIGIVSYVLLVINSVVISAALHIIVLALGIITLEVDHVVMIYRDLLSMGRIPVDLYQEPLRTIITFVVPVGLMISIPAKSFFNLLNPIMIFFTFSIGIGLMYISIKFWKFALKKYTSASS